MDLSPSEKQARLDTVLTSTGSPDRIQVMNLLEATGYDVNLCLQLFKENEQASADFSPVTVVVNFEEEVYRLSLPRTATLADVKRALVKESNIVEREQLLVEQTTQVEPPAEAALTTYPRVGDEIVLHLLSPNSAV
eukprot:m.84145 g.84145  ORF g.84145 m.84145 type:complete len:136 (-) comp15006_c2_seq6:57-464(-)